MFHMFCIHGEACAKILCSEKELLNLKDSKLTQNFYGNKTDFVRLGDIYTYFSLIPLVYCSPLCRPYLIKDIENLKNNNVMSLSLF